MKSQNKQTGKLGEDLAADFLVKKGYKILDRNYATKFGELDIVALDCTGAARNAPTKPRDTSTSHRRHLHQSGNQNH